ncbi:MAG: MBL fold metallo-hydrolase [Candidatus Taylorbacteria bacterium]
MKINKPKVKVVLLGTGFPFPFPDRIGPSLAIIVDDKSYIIDAGSGAVRRMQKAFDDGELALEPKKIEKLFVTHLHSDHTLGYPDIILTPWVMGRKNPLEVYGPKGIKSMTENILEAYKEDIYIRTHGLENGNHTGYKVNTHDIKSGIIYKDEHVKVKAFKVKHGIWKEAYGFTFIVGDKKIVISGDTKPHPNVIKEAKDCDLLVHEVYAMNRLKDANAPWTKYLKTFHTSTEELAEIGNKTKPKKIVLIHQIDFNNTNKKVVSEVTSKYKGKVIYGKDLDSFIV